MQAFKYAGTMCWGLHLTETEVYALRDATTYATIAETKAIMQHSEDPFTGKRVRVVADPSVRNAESMLIHDLSDDFPATDQPLEVRCNPSLWRGIWFSESRPASMGGHHEVIFNYRPVNVPSSRGN